MMITTGRFLRFIDACCCSAGCWASLPVMCGTCGCGYLRKLACTSLKNEGFVLVRLHRRHNEVASISMIAARKRVWIAIGRRFHCDWSSVSQTSCRVTRGNTARRASVLKSNSSVETFDGVMMIPNLLHKSAYVCLRSVQIQFGFVPSSLSFQW